MRGIDDVNNTLPKEDQRALQIFQKEITFDGERYSVTLPFKTNAPKLQNN